jgi:hypothetical protein
MQESLYIMDRALKICDPNGSCPEPASGLLTNLQLTATLTGPWPWGLKKRRASKHRSYGSQGHKLPRSTYTLRPGRSSRLEIESKSKRLFDLSQHFAGDFAETTLKASDWNGSQTLDVGN